MVIFYHYTTEESLRAIQRNRYIRPSLDVSNKERHSGPGGRHGSGVYLTDMNPRDYNRKDVARNNYRSGWEKNLEKTDHFIEVEIPDEDPRLRFVDGRTWIYKDGINSDMFQLSGANVGWDVGALAFSAAASMYSLYQREQKNCEEARKLKEAEELRRAGLMLMRSMGLKTAVKVG
eukprot:CAMPEP_0172534868 /NCGR_PEP_ID=MMETSP1067-20121228/7090_1 /TAXON_ID=265564 ORGANISM="Thalassiosira punctigera, Strain Tpunct2005C2" /NCGR_SAMPLE_ID=MMETSP1067 /ASSEMBLY_ACC=CAM_ASM_000444 /LENGTH=175 /DNA_ID=CAMNT_0013319721 /DNA_START=198 /DNA_END=721 /DNA_ORIENTATION=-